MPTKPIFGHAVSIRLAFERYPSGGGRLDEVGAIIGLSGQVWTR
jgi:hypothetical protein